MIREIIESEGIILKRTGNYLTGRSPFTDSSLPLLVVDEDEDKFTDLATGISGDAVTFVEKIKGISNETAFKLVNKTEEIEENFDILKNIIRDTQDYFIDNMKKKEADLCIKYLEKRGFDKEQIEEYGFGFAPSYGSNLYKHLLKTYKREDIFTSGVCKLNKDNKPVDLMWNRLTIPIKNTKGEIVAFGGRVLDDGTPKYINSPESPIFKKRELLFGYDISKDIKCNAYILCEGYMDTLSLHKAGFTNAVASLGTALTKNQCELLTNKRRVYVLYDSDNAGVNASIKAIPMLEDIGLDTRVIDYSPYKDPDEFLKAEGRDVLAEKILNENKKGESFVVEKLIEKDKGLAISYLRNKSISKQKSLFEEVK